ncbi:hypothetical protein KLP40_11550 [Hymenobacter sp. NST-14]|uniref:hypothetical protein n=1 Tax=Hymenobacter piscis TaxID=2839984 RepID=UPI001C00B441|nr:hypothetical protein [Hymenobacter piscis]MBT9393798.1 hypothetical protein [Hymenobacter piscis]
MIPSIKHLFWGLALLAATQARAQRSQDPEDISTGQQLIQQAGATPALLPAASPDNQNQALLTQQGNGNQATIEQHLLSAGRGNVATILQTGNGNAAAALQTGLANRTTITQVGTGNVAVSDLTGYNTESNILQNGNRNQVDQQLVRDNQRYSVEQQGNNNNLLQRETGGNAPGYNVTMRGNGINVMIEQGKATQLP